MQDCFQGSKNVFAIMAKGIDLIISASIIVALLTGCVSSKPPPVVDSPTPEQIEWAHKVLELDAEQKALERREQANNGQEVEVTQMQAQVGTQQLNAETQVPDERSKDQIEKVAIDSVIGQINVASIQLTNSLNELQNDPISAALSHKMGDILQKYHDDLVAIDISGCLDDFRIAFVKYYQAVLDSKEYADSITGWNGFFKGMANGVIELLNLHDNTDKAFDPLVKAGNEFELICTKYHVDIK